MGLQREFRWRLVEGLPLAFGRTPPIDVLSNFSRS